MGDRNNLSLFWCIFIILMILLIGFFGIRYHFLSTDIGMSRVQNLAANFTSSSAANFTLRKRDPTKGVVIHNCTDVVNIGRNSLPSGYQIMSKSISSTEIVFCELVGKNIKPVKFSVIGID